MCFSINLVVTITCEYSFQLNSLIKTNIWVIITDKRMNHSYLLKYYVEKVMDINVNEVINEFITNIES